MYNSSVDAFAQLLMNRGEATSPLEGPELASISSKISILRNGINHCCVEVRLENGMEYRIEAFGVEAEELHRMAAQTSVPNNIITQSKTTLNYD